MKKIIILIVFALIIFLSGCVSNSEINVNQHIQDKQHALQEMSFDNQDVIKTTVVERWSVFIVAGGEKSIAYVDKENVVNFVYGNLEYNNETVYRPITINRNKVEIVTIPNNTQPYVRFIDANCDSVECNSITPYNTPNSGYYEWNWKINRVRFYLPEGWKILKSEQR
jgi:hypothetical protein